MGPFNDILAIFSLWRKKCEVTYLLILLSDYLVFVRLNNNFVCVINWV